MFTIIYESNTNNNVYTVKTTELLYTNNNQIINQHFRGLTTIPLSNFLLIADRTNYKTAFIT